MDERGEVDEAAGDAVAADQLEQHRGLKSETEAQRRETREAEARGEHRVAPREIPRGSESDPDSVGFVPLWKLFVSIGRHRPMTD
jgi:hypothetical protein